MQTKTLSFSMAAFFFHFSGLAFNDIQVRSLFQCTGIDFKFPEYISLPKYNCQHDYKYDWLNDTKYPNIDLFVSHAQLSCPAFQ